LSGLHILAIPKSVILTKPTHTVRAKKHTFFVEHQVFRLDVSVDDVLVVDVLQACDQTSDEES
jgi:hypothetical protein